METDAPTNVGGLGLRDVVIVLFVFFVVLANSGAQERENQVAITLPKATLRAPDQQDQKGGAMPPVEIRLQGDRKVFVGGKEVEPKQMDIKPGQQIILTVDRTAPLDAYLELQQVLGATRAETWLRVDSKEMETKNDHK